MPQFTENHVKICGCFVVWDGITRPDKNPDGTPKYSLKVVCDPNSPDMGLFYALANKKLIESKWKGNLPPGARMPVGTAQPDEFNGMYNGWAVLNCNSNRVPDVYSEEGAPLDPMQYGPMLYGGQRVDVLVHCYEYDKAGNKGVATGLDAFSIIASVNAPRQNFGGSGVNTAGAFGGGCQPQGGQPTYGQPQGGQPTYGQPQGGQPTYGQPQGGQPTYGQPQGGQPPQQAHNFLPQGGQHNPQ